MTKQQFFKEDLYERIQIELSQMNGDAEWELYINNEEYFQKQYDENMEMEMYYLKDINDYDLNDLLRIADEILERSGKSYSIIDYVDDKLIFEGYENLRHGEYLKRKKELNK